MTLKTNMSKNATVDPDNFAKNAFSNFAPLLTLFGDEVTKQFFATSMGIADTILLGIAPLGIMTVMVSAIRVGGNRFMKSMVGRTRDSPDEEEEEILSSTSANVREIWDGNRVIRQTGEAKTVALEFQPSLLNHPTTDRFQLLRFRNDFFIHKIRIRCRSQEVYVDEKAPPSITINMNGAIPNKWTVTIFACVGFLIQAAVIIVNALAVYRWRWLRAGRLVGAYGYPTWCAGTVSITLGTCMCGWIVESSTIKFESRSSDKEHQNVLFQKEIPDLSIPAYMIPLDGPTLQCSTRMWPLSWLYVVDKKKKKMSIWRQIVTALGTLITLAGFICQNVGTRELHWSAGLMQLGTTLILSLLRALLRRNVGDPPQNHLDDETGDDVDPDTQLYQMQLQPRYETCELVTRLTRRLCYLPSLVGPRLAFTSYDIQEIRSLRGNTSEIEHLLDLGEPFAIHNEITVSNILEAQALLADIVPDTDEVKELAANCFVAMEKTLAWLKVIFNAYNDNPYNESDFALPHWSSFTSMMIMKTPRGWELNPPRATTMTRIQPLDPDHQKRISTQSISTQSIQAIINLTRYAYRGFENGDPYPIQAIRILGHCKLVDLKAYVLLLNAWINRDELSGAFIPAPRERLALDSPQHLPEAIFFGLSHSYAFESWVQQTEALQQLERDKDRGGRRHHISRLENGEDRPVSSYTPDVELVWVSNLRSEKSLNKAIALELLSSFMLYITRFWKRDVVNSGKTDPENACTAIIDFLMECQIFDSKAEAAVAVVPAFISSGILFRWPQGYSPPKHDDSTTWDDEGVLFERLPRPFGSKDEKVMRQDGGAIQVK